MLVLVSLNLSREPIIFIDEFAKKEKIIFLRSLTRAVKIPCIIASTNSLVSNMITWIPGGSRGDPTTWCHVFSLLDPASFESIISAIPVPNQILEIMTAENDSSILAVVERKELKKVLDLIQQQSLTGLQGIISMAIRNLVDILNKHQNSKPQIQMSASEMLKEIIDNLVSLILVRKPSLKQEKYFFFTLDTYSLFSPIFMKVLHQYLLTKICIILGNMITVTNSP